MPAPSENSFAAKVRAEPNDRLERLNRSVMSLINKIAPDNLQTIVNRLAMIELDTAEELQQVIATVFKKALDEPHYVETYADMMTALRTRYPEFPAAVEGDPPSSFTRLLLTTVQQEYESLPKTLECDDEMKAKYPDPDELNFQVSKMKKKFLANMKLIGQLYLRQLLSIKIIHGVLQELLFCSGKSSSHPEEHFLECVCTLIRGIGYTLDSTEAGKHMLTNCMGRLAELRKIAEYSKRVSFVVQDLMDLRRDGWKAKVFLEGAKKVQDIHKAAKQLARDGKMFEVALVGARPAHLSQLTVKRPSTQGTTKVVTLTPEVNSHKGSQSASSSAVPPWVARQKSPTDDASREPQVDKAKLKNILGYFFDDADSEALLRDFRALGLSDSGRTVAAKWLLVQGFTASRAKRELLATAVVKLVEAGVLGEDSVFQPLRHCAEILEDLILDAPEAKQFYYALASEAHKQGGCGWVLAPLVKHPQAHLLCDGLEGEIRRVYQEMQKSSGAAKC